jgi:excisionase family DNA binding protein
MRDMKQPELPIPDVRQWMTRRAAAKLLGCSVRTVERMTEAGTLRAYYPHSDGTEVAPMLLFGLEVRLVAEARARLARVRKPPVGSNA